MYIAHISQGRAGDTFLSQRGLLPVAVTANRGGKTAGFIYCLRVLPVSEARERDVEGDGG